MSKIEKLESPQVNQVINGDLTVTGNILGKWASKIQAMVDRLLGGYWSTHSVLDADRSATLVVNTSTNTAGVWSAAVTMTGVPAGAKAAWCWCDIVLAGIFTRLRVEAATGYTLSDITVGTNRFKYFGIDGDAQNGSLVGGPVLIYLDANGQFKWCTHATNTTVQIGSAIAYEM